MLFKSRARCFYLVFSQGKMLLIYLKVCEIIFTLEKFFDFILCNLLLNKDF